VEAAGGDGKDKTRLNSDLYDFHDFFDFKITVIIIIIGITVQTFFDLQSQES